MSADMSEGYLKWHESLSPSHCRQYTAWQIAEQAFQAGAAWQAAQGNQQVSELPDYFSMFCHTALILDLVMNNTFIRPLRVINLFNADFMDLVIFKVLE